jgi:hypothetical protein
MAKRRKSLASLSQEQAHQALTFLVQEGKLAAGAVQKALDNRERLIREIRERLVKLGVESVRMAERAGKTAGKELRKAEKRSRPARKRAVSAATRAARKAQGQYLGAIRQLSKAARKEIKAIRAKSGVGAAIAAAKRMAK